MIIIPPNPNSIYQTIFFVSREFYFSVMFTHENSTPRKDGTDHVIAEGKLYVIVPASSSPVPREIPGSWPCTFEGSAKNCLVDVINRINVTSPSLSFTWVYTNHEDLITLNAIDAALLQSGIKTINAEEADLDPIQFLGRKNLTS